MNKIFAGLIFLLVKINLNLFGLPIEFFPDFAAYIFIYFGLLELSVTVPIFKKSLKPVIFIIFYNIAVDLINLVPQITYNGFAFDGTFKLFSGLLTVYVFYIIILGIRDYQEKANVIIETELLKKRWTAYCVVVMASPLFRTLTYYDASVLSQLANGDLRGGVYGTLGYVGAASLYGIICWITLALFTFEFNKVRVIYNESRRTAA